MPAATFDDSAWPIVTVSYSGGFTADELDAYLNGLRGLIMKGKFSIVFDMNEAPKLPEELMAKWRTWFTQFGEVFSQSCKAAAYVVNGQPSRAAMMIIGAQRVKCPIKAHASSELALKWLKNPNAGAPAAPSAS